MRVVRALFVATAGLVGLSGCVGTDPYAGLRAGPGASRAMVPVQTASVPTETAPMPVTGAMPGDLLVAPERGAAGINPQAILTRSEARSARATPSRGSAATYAAAAIESEPRRAPARAARSAASPLLAAHLGPADASVSTGLRSVPGAGLGPLGEVEARAEIEQRAQARRDQRFDSQVRRASSLVCSGCLSAPARGRSSAERAAPDADD